jgi:hypothetical protein
MSLHRLNSGTIGAPEVSATRDCYRGFGRTAGADDWFATRDGGRQPRIVDAPARRVTELPIAAS